MTTNVTLDATNDITVVSPLLYNSPNSLSLLAGNSIFANASVQNTGLGALFLVSGWDGVTTSPSQFTNPGVYGNNGGSILIGGFGASGDVAVGSAGGTTLAGANVTVEADREYGYAQAGYHGSAAGNTIVVATADVSVAANSFDALIGNGGTGVTGDVGGAISVNAAGNIFVNEIPQRVSRSIIAAIGNVGDDGASSQSGDISVTAGGGLGVQAQGIGSLAYIGNFSLADTTGGATGAITINANAVTVEATDAGAQAIIGNGGRFTNAGTTGGDISITAGSVVLYAPTNTDDDSAGQARIANRGTGDVGGDTIINTTGDINLYAGDSELASIGNGQGGTGTTFGNVTNRVRRQHLAGVDQIRQCQRIGVGNTTKPVLSVTAAGNITLSTAADPTARRPAAKASSAISKVPVSAPRAARSL